jgi:iron complex outermembrane receptor protein
VSSVARAEDECLRTLAPNAAASATQIVWAAPLNRTISLKLGALSLRSALDRVAQVAKLRLSYSRELIPLERSVCLAYNGVPVGDVLTQLLEGTGIEAIALGNEQVVLAPQRHAEATRAADVSHDLAVSTPAVLSPVVVRDGGPASRTLPAGTASVSLGAEKLLSSNITTMSQLMNGSIPGMWMWESSASGTMAQYGSLRGASSFGVGAPKVYIDGRARHSSAPTPLTELFGSQRARMAPTAVLGAYRCAVRPEWRRAASPLAACFRRITH